MKTIGFLIPYFGNLPEYFNEWLYSVSFLEKQDIHFILMTDCVIDFNLPKNLRVINTSFVDFRNKIQQKFDFPISLESPYKICDFRPAFGYLFPEILSEFDFWGNCDLDQIWGDFRAIITKEILDQYEKILYLGHCTLYKNNVKLNNLFMLKGSIVNYKKVLSSHEFYAFDEFSGIGAISKKQGIKTYISDVFADISVRYKRIILNRVKNYDYQILYWENGKVFRSYLNDNGIVNTDEFLYFHFQKSNPKSINSYKTNPKRIIIHKDMFESIEISSITKEFIVKHSDYISKKEDKLDKIKYIKSKLNLFMKASFRIKIIWLKRKLFL
jgi:hypothetical protein